MVTYPISAFLPTGVDAFSESNPVLLSPQQMYFHPPTFLPNTAKKRSSRHLHVLFSTADEEAHLQGIGVGIDLGTTNSALAMMIPEEQQKQNGRMKTVPTIIEVDGKRTIPSVVSFVPQSNRGHPEHSRNFASSVSLPPWSEKIMQDYNLSGDDFDFSWPNLLTIIEERDPTNIAQDSEIPSYKILVGQPAIEAEQFYPRSSYRNVKRIIGTGGTMSQLALGVVPNLFIDSVHSKSTSSYGSSAIGDISLDELTKVLGEDISIDNETSGKKNNGKGKNKTWKSKKKQKKKKLEIPKLHRQLEQAELDPAMLTFTPSCNDAVITEWLRPEQISACILRKLYDTAEEFYRKRNNVGHDGNLNQTKVTRAVIGVPAYFTEAQRQATIRASEMAGVSKVKLLPEPEAAALAYGVNNGSARRVDEYGMEMENVDEESELILVFDLGGGTFDVSILEVGGGVSEVLATVGNNRLGEMDLQYTILIGQYKEFSSSFKNHFLIMPSLSQILLAF